jgi:hypothetical protein
MNTSIKSVITLILIVFLLGACQQEEIIVKDPEGKTLDSMSPLADLVTQTTMNDGSADNIIDHSSCISVVLPVTVIANGTELVISTPDDYVLIERIFDESPDDQDVLEIVYPINVKLPDHSIEDIKSDEELAEVTEDCLEGGEDLDIECIDFKYPVSVSLYNAASQVAEIIELSNDEAMSDFLKSLDEESVFSFNYPLTMVLSDSSEIVVNSNDELEALIDEVDDSCDEDDDFDYDDDDVDTEDLDNIIMSTAWIVTYHFDQEEHTAAFENMVFSFKEDEKAQVLVENLLIEGSWESYGDDGKLELEMEFISDYPFDLLKEDDWSVLSYDNTVIELSYLREDGTYALLTLEATEQSGEPGPSVADYIVMGEWVVAMFKDDGVEETQNYSSYKIDFSADLKLTYYNDLDTYDGSWQEIFTLDGHYLALDFGSGSSTLEKLENEWGVVSYSESRIELVSVDTDPETTDNLILEKLQ